MNIGSYLAKFYGTRSLAASQLAAEILNLCEGKSYGTVKEAEFIVMDVLKSLSLVRLDILEAFENQQDNAVSHSSES